jgi:hypothetical protein
MRVEISAQQSAKALEKIQADISADSKVRARLAVWEMQK